MFLQTDYPAGLEPVDVSITDMNGDVIPDVVVVDYNAFNILVYLGSGDGRLGSRFSTPTGSPMLALAVGDINRDGWPDVATADFERGTLLILLGNGDGSFRPSVSYSIGLNPFSVALGDLNHDGNLDVVVGLHYNLFGIRLGNGDGTFGPETVVQGSGPARVILADVNRDGHLDAIVANGQILVCLGNGNGTFRQPLVAPMYGNRVVAGDLNGDGILDLVSSVQSGSFLTVQLGSFRSGSSYPTAVDPLQLALGDMNRDGFLDVAVPTYYDGSVSLFPGHGDGTLGAATVIPVASRMVAVTVGDLNRDGWPDLVTANDIAGTISVLLNTGGPPTSVQISRISAEADPGRVRLRCYVEGDRSESFAVERTARQDAWVRVGQLVVGGDGSASYEDREVIPGTRYGYRLRSGSGSLFGEAWVDVPVAPRLGIAAVTPDPATRELGVEFSLPGPSQAVLELRDLAGRSIVRREVGSMGSGTHHISLSGTNLLPAGVYFVTLRQGGARASAKATVVR